MITYPDEQDEKEEGRPRDQKPIYRVIYNGSNHYDSLRGMDPESAAADVNMRPGQEEAEEEAKEEPEEDLAGTCQDEDGWNEDGKPFRCVCPVVLGLSGELERINGSRCTLVAHHKYDGVRRRVEMSEPDLKKYEAGVR